MKNKLIITLLVIATICSTIFLGGTLRQKNNLKAELNAVQSEATSLQDELNQKKEDLSKSKKDLKDIKKTNSSLKSELEIANKTIEELKGHEYKLVYLGNFKLTHYCDERYSHICGGNGVTASGTKTSVGRTVAVDPRKIPYGTKMYIEGYGWRVAEDCGSAVKNNQIDILVSTHSQALSMGTRSGGVWILVKNS